MRRKLIPQKDFFFYIMLCMFVTNTVTFAQSNDAYLNALKSEASDLTLDQKTEIQNTKTNNSVEPPILTNGAASSSEPGKIPKGLSKEAFSSHIKANYFGTYIFMKRLNAAQKQEVYDFYTENNDPQAIRTKILAVSKK